MTCVRWATDALPCCVAMDVGPRRVNTLANVCAVQMSRRDRLLIETAAMRLPAVAIEPCDSPPCRDGRPTFQRRISPMGVVEVLRCNRMVEHAAQGTAIHDASMDTQADDPPGVLVHHDQHPMASEDRRLAPEQVDAPQGVFRMPQERQPGGAAPAQVRSISGCRRSDRSAARSADTPTWGCAASSRRWRPPKLWTALWGRCGGAWVKTAIGTCGDAESDGNPESSTVSVRSPSGSRGPGA